MSMITELFGDEILTATLSEIKQKIKSLPPALKEKRGYLLKDFAAINRVFLTRQDFDDVDA